MILGGQVTYGPNPTPTPQKYLYFILFTEELEKIKNLKCNTQTLHPPKAAYWGEELLPCESKYEIEGTVWKRGSSLSLED